VLSVPVTEQRTQIVWHSTGLTERPKWAIVFGGIDYFIVLITYVNDASGEDRPILFCSPVLSYNDIEFPLPSLAVYMALAAKLPQSELLARF